VIDAENVTFDYPSGRALHGIGFIVRAGAVLAMVGPNGAGKSTLMRCIAALDTPTSGTISVAGLDTQDDPRGVHAALGYLPDSFGLYDALTVRQSLAYAARARRVGVNETEGAVALAAERVGLTDRLDQLAGELSRGLRQRLAIGQTIVHAPRVLLLDEPAAGLDPGARQSLSALIRELAGTGMTVMVSSHLLSELEDYCTEMLMLEDGRVIGDSVVRLASRTAAPDEPVRILVTFAPVEDLGIRLTDLGFQLERASPDEAVVLIAPGPEAEQDALSRLVASGLPVRGFTPIRTTLEDVYMAAQAGEAQQP